MPRSALSDADSQPYGGITNKPAVFNDVSPDYTSKLKAGMSFQSSPEDQPPPDLSAFPFKLYFSLDECLNVR